MNHPDLSDWTHTHDFASGNPTAERNTWRVVALTAIMMVVEIIAGWLFHSMALLADGWHMGTHVAALGITVWAYVLARRHAGDPQFAFGTWKMEALGGFASALVLGMVVLYMVGESVHRLCKPLDIRYDQALIVAVVGLIVNLVSALLLQAPNASGTHAPGHTPSLGQAHSHGDLNLRAAYLHVLADALTSALAIVALLGGRLCGWSWLDPVMGLVGAVVVSFWAVGLVRDTSRVLLDREMDHGVVQEIRDVIEGNDATWITDLHIWRVGRAQFACIVSLVAAQPKTATEYRAQLAVHEELVHITVEVAQLSSVLASGGSCPSN
jgi:cation diffusion facilitator family transporter